MEMRFDRSRSTGREESKQPFAEGGQSACNEYSERCSALEHCSTQRTNTNMYTILSRERNEAVPHEDPDLFRKEANSLPF
uniref:Uncharacterized protein n=1 Tax=Vespula pensylvanica TaxID=30213 RepID=A0A834KQ19_VESPE|nr:hypothetical protein H0235_013285 [Vespula pensylvanica]